VSCLPVDLPRGKSMLLPTGKCGTSLAWCWTFLASKVGSFLASADSRSAKTTHWRSGSRNRCRTSRLQALPVSRDTRTKSSDFVTRALWGTCNWAPFSGRLDLEALPSLGAYGEYQHRWAKTLRSSWTYGLNRISNTKAEGNSAFRQAYYVSGNLIWRPFQAAEMGI